MPQGRKQKNLVPRNKSVPPKKHQHPVKIKSTGVLTLSEHNSYVLHCTVLGILL